MSPLALFQTITGGHHSTEFPSTVHTTESDSKSIAFVSFRPNKTIASVGFVVSKQNHTNEEMATMSCDNILIW